MTTFNLQDFGNQGLAVQQDVEEYPFRASAADFDKIPIVRWLIGWSYYFPLPSLQMPTASSHHRQNAIFRPSAIAQP